MSHDLVTLGEAMLRLSVPIGERLEDASSYRVAVAGAEANVAVAVARMGHSAAWFSRLPDSPLGRRVTRELRAHGVDVEGVRWVDGARLGVYFIEQASPPRGSRVIYDRAGSAAAGMTPEGLPWSLLEGAGVIHLTGITPALSESCREAVIEVARWARSAETLLSVDVNYRSALWSPEAARPVLRELCREADLVIVAERDARAVLGVEGEPETLTERIQELVGAVSVVVTRGERGSVWRLGDRSGSTPSYPVQVVDRIGAGDAFAAGAMVGLLRDDLELGVRYGTAMAALVLGWAGDQFWGDEEEVRRLLGGGGSEVRR